MRTPRPLSRQLPVRSRRREVSPPLRGRRVQRLHRHGPAAGHDHRPVGQLVQLGQHVAGHEHGRAGPCQLADDPAQLDPGARIQTRGRLVEQQHARGVHQRAGQSQPLLLATAEHLGRAVRQVDQVHQLQQLVDPPASRRPGQPVGIGDGGQHFAAGQRLPGAEHVRHPPGAAADLQRLGNRVEAGHAHRPGVRDEQGGQHQQQGGLA
ncbi:MAG TPA: hypothetical protein VHN80_31900 [Kineosporiaceae bacterium]|nr:hypothetical protein [Kineosporiaceae bacterium]